MGYTVATKDDTDSLIDPEYGGMWMLRGALDAETVGVSLIDLEPGGKGKPHDHEADGQEEVYLVVEGTLDVDVDGETVRVGPDEAIRVAADTHRQLQNRGDERVKVVAVGAA